MNKKEKKYVDNAIDEFIGMKVNRSNSSNAQYGWVWGNGEFEYADYTYCHGKLMELGDGGYYDDDDEWHPSWDGDSNIIAVLNQIQTPAAEEKNALRYYEWLFNFSPYRSVFPEKDSAAVYDRTVFSVDVEAPANLMVGGLMASRFPSENYSGSGLYRLCNLWGELIDREVHPNLAYTVSNMMSLSQSGDVRVSNGSSDHSPVEPIWYPDTHKNFIKDMPITLLSPYKNLLDYNTIQATWDDGGGRDWEDDNDIPECALNLKIIDLVNVVSSEKMSKVNPFAAAQSRSGGDFDDNRESKSRATKLADLLDPLALLLNRETKGLLA